VRPHVRALKHSREHVHLQRSTICRQQRSESALTLSASTEHCYSPPVSIMALISSMHAGACRHAARVYLVDDLALLVALRTLLVHVEPPHLRHEPRHASAPSPSGGRRGDALAGASCKVSVSSREHSGSNPERRPHRRRIAEVLAALRRPLGIIGVLRLAVVLNLGPGLLAHGGQATNSPHAER